MTGKKRGWFPSGYAPPNSYAEALMPSVTVLKIQSFKEIIKLKWGHKGGALIQ